MPKIVNEKLAETMRKMGFDLNTKGKFINVDCTFGSVGRFISENKNIRKLCENSYNSEKIRGDIQSDEDSGFKGATASEFLDWSKGKIPLDPYEEKRQELIKKGLTRRLNTVLADVTPRRKRRMSEHDGEWDYGRQWELKPFSSSFRTRSAGRIITLNCHFAFNCRNNAGSIQKYGAFVWAIAKIIEDAGIQTEIVYHKETHGVNSGNRLNYKLTCLIKKPGQYITPNHLAFVFSAPFYRRFNFAVTAACCDLTGNMVCSEGGTPYAHGSEHVKFENGALSIGPSAPKMGQKELENELLIALGGKPSIKQ